MIKGCPHFEDARCSNFLAFHLWFNRVTKGLCSCSRKGHMVSVQKVVIQTAQGLQETWQDLFPENYLLWLTLYFILLGGLSGPLIRNHASHWVRWGIFSCVHHLGKIIKVRRRKKNMGVTEKHPSIRWNRWRICTGEWIIHSFLVHLQNFIAFQALLQVLGLQQWMRLGP